MAVVPGRWEWPRPPWPTRRRRRSTGYVIGGISPFGQGKRLPTVVNSSAMRWDRVLCSAGKRGWDVVVHPQDLIRLSNAVTADIRAS